VTVAYNHHRFELELALLTAPNPKAQCEDIFAQCADLFGLDPKHIKIGWFALSCPSKEQATLWGICRFMSGVWWCGLVCVAVHKGKLMTPATLTHAVLHSHPTFQLIGSVPGTQHWKSARERKRKERLQKQAQANATTQSRSSDSCVIA
jgi:hypothetical protein